MVNRVTRTVLFAASALLYISAFGAGAARFGTLRNSDWVVTNAWQAVSNKTHDLILEIGQGGSSTGIVYRALSYGTETNWTDATGCVWEVSFGAWSVTHSPPLRENDFFGGPEWFDDDSIAGDYFVGPGWYIWSSSLTYERISDDLDFNSYTFEWEGDGVNYVTVCIRPTLTNFVGRVALTNDIPTVDYTTNNAQLVATIEVTAPAPGNYSAVSNAAMNARSANNLGVRGRPVGSFSLSDEHQGWFVVDGVRCDWNNFYHRWIGGEFSISDSGSYLLYTNNVPVDYFILDGNFSSSFEGFSIIGYTNTLAQVSQIPSLSGLQPFDFSDMRGVFLSLSNIIHVLGGSVTNFPTFNQ